MSVNIYTAAGLKKLAGSGFMDAELNENSNNGVKNSVLKEKFDEHDEAIGDLSDNGKSFRFGYDSANDQYGYYKEVAGADTFIPFSSGLSQLILVAAHYSNSQWYAGSTTLKSSELPSSKVKVIAKKGDANIVIADVLPTNPGSTTDQIAFSNPAVGTELDLSPRMTGEYIRIGINPTGSYVSPNDNVWIRLEFI